MAYFNRVATDTEVAYEVVAEPIQEPPAGEQQTEEAVEQAPEEATNPARQAPEHIPYLKYSMLYLKYCAFTFKELIGTIDA